MKAPESAAPTRLWAKDLPLDGATHRFTVGDDPVLDLQLLEHDCVGSAAHARMLVSTGLLDKADGNALLLALHILYGKAQLGELTIDAAQEDGHTAIEMALTAQLGDPGKRIHLARSRNDQVLLALRLLMRERCFGFATQLQQLIASLLNFAAAHEQVALPGYTHLQRAMPSTVGLWAAGYAQGFTEELEALEGVLRRLDRCPLGAAAGFGVPLPIDRQQVADSLGFARVQAVVTDVMNSRGRIEQALLDWLASVSLSLEKLAWDISLYCSAEFGYFALADAFTTGSSIMPQKRNPDVAELLRARARELRSLRTMHADVVSGLPSSYHRDLQISKRPLLEALTLGATLLDIQTRLIPAIHVNTARCSDAMSDDLYATALAYRRVADGMSFRDAYREVGAAVLAGTLVVDRDAHSAAHIGSANALDLSALRAETAVLTSRIQTHAARVHACVDRIFDPLV